MDLADIRQTIDGIDTTLLNSFVERMGIATEVAKSKIEMGKTITDHFVSKCFVGDIFQTNNFATGRSTYCIFFIF